MREPYRLTWVNLLLDVIDAGKARLAGLGRRGAPLVRNAAAQAMRHGAPLVQRAAHGMRRSGPLAQRAAHAVRDSVGQAVRRAAPIARRAAEAGRDAARQAAREAAPFLRSGADIARRATHAAAHGVRHVSHVVHRRTRHALRIIIPPSDEVTPSMIRRRLRHGKEH